MMHATTFLTLFSCMFPSLYGVKYVFKFYPTGHYVWNGCLFRVADWLIPSNSTKCGQCVQSGTKLAKNTDKYFMTFRNCTEVCTHPTICTAYKFNFNGSWRPECFACDAETKDHVIYKAIPVTELCGQFCAKCAATADLRNATNCYKACRGKPTFCPPNEPLFFGQTICYQATKLHSCHWKTDSYSHMLKIYGHECIECATTVGKKDADLCSHHCGNLPAWHSHYFGTKNISKSGHESHKRIQIHRCVLPELAEVLEYEIPDKLKSFMNNQTTLYTNMFRHQGLKLKLHLNGSEILGEEDDDEEDLLHVVDSRHPDQNPAAFRSSDEGTRGTDLSNSIEDAGGS